RLAADVAVPIGDKHIEWNEDAFVFEAFRLALTTLLERLRPTETPLQKAELDPALRDVLTTPEAWAKSRFWNVWSDFSRTSTYTAEALKEHPERDYALERELYGMDDARRDLRKGEQS